MSEDCLVVSTHVEDMLDTNFNIGITFSALVHVFFICQFHVGSHGCSGLVVEYRTRNREVAGMRVRLTRGPLQATLSKLLTYCVLRPTQPSTLSGTGNEQQLWLWGEGLVWLIEAMVCLVAAPWVQLSVVSASNGWPHNVLRHRWLMPISCHFRDCKVVLIRSLTRVSGAIASVQTFTFTVTVTFLMHRLQQTDGALHSP